MSGSSRIDCDKVAGNGFRGPGFFLAPCANRPVMTFVLLLLDCYRSATRSGHAAEYGVCGGAGRATAEAVPASERRADTIVAPIPSRRNQVLAARAAPGRRLNQAA
jgi:hypothetical protein